MNVAGNLAWQLVEAALLLGVAFIGLVLPHFVRKNPKQIPFLAFGNAFSGGMDGCMHGLALPFCASIQNRGFQKLVDRSQANPQSPVYMHMTQAFKCGVATNQIPKQ
jgi:hypothetical protein